MNYSENDRRIFAGKLLDWFSRAMRSLPWRRDYHPYRVWISEIMLQQTQMDRGVRYFNAWMRRFPDIQSVARASEDEVLAAWEGLGYYSRARNLHAAAKRIVEQHGGVFPDSVEEIHALPGVGVYTAAAIASIVFNIPEPVVDANVLRIFSRLLDIDAPVAGAAVKERVGNAVRALMPPESARLFNQALMELGALVCGKVPRCDTCPIAEFCLAHARGTTADRPVKMEKKTYKLHERVAAVVRDGDRVLVRKRPAGGLWPLLWEFPGGDVLPDESARDAVVRTVAEETGLDVTAVEDIGTVIHGYTTNRVTLHGFLCESAGGDASGCQWLSVDEVRRLSFAAGHRKIMEKLGWK